ncbi:hypothetical protein BTZ20_0595 [Rhodococcus sp. MTM3W5.2]|nr:hypothetical protein BTZ20_0595 [Rhodococcus sp. MTM3W5.2]
MAGGVATTESLLLGHLPRSAFGVSGFDGRGRLVARCGRTGLRRGAGTEHGQGCCGEEDYASTQATSHGPRLTTAPNDPKALIRNRYISQTMQVAAPEPRPRR